MRLVVLGASGGCGRQLVDRADRRGHDVVAVGRVSSRILVPDGIQIARGELDDEIFLHDVFEGAHAVISAVGLRLQGYAPWSRPEDPHLLSRSVPAWVSAMRVAKVDRIVAISAAGVGDSRDAVPLPFRAAIRGSALRYAYRELEAMEGMLSTSGLDWCCPRPSVLTDGSATMRVQEVPALGGVAQIPRADVANWILDAVEAGRFAQRTPMITVTGAA